MWPCATMRTSPRWPVSMAGPWNLPRISAIKRSRRVVMSSGLLQKRRGGGCENSDAHVTCQSSLFVLDSCLSLSNGGGLLLGKRHSLSHTSHKEPLYSVAQVPSSYWYSLNASTRETTPQASTGEVGCYVGNGEARAADASGPAGRVRRKATALRVKGAAASGRQTEREEPTLLPGSHPSRCPSILRCPAPCAWP